MTPKNIFQAVFFDLDGTLLDTAPDLAQALNQLLKKYGHPVLSLEEIRPTVAQGSAGMLGKGFKMTPEDPRYVPIRTEFLDSYRQCMTQKTNFFPGIEQVLKYLDDAKIPWGIVTNKPGWLAEPLLKHFKLNERYRCLVAGDLLPKRKPHPEPLWHACQLVNVNPEQSLYIGDAEEDAIAAKAAGMKCLIAKYGYADPNKQSHEWPADHFIENPADIISWLKQ